MESNRPPPVAEVDLPDLPDLPPNDNIPEESADALDGSEDPSDLNATSFDPPDRLAARFYSNNRPPVNRRKSSAASSRRNSLSSTHSVQSNSSYRAACRSNHVAQYLRRASIIEGRKARLAAREAHAEQVRLRAALAKSSARVASNATEERALAARQAREKKLAEIAASCAEEVRKAKRIAEETKERRAAEEERSRQAMEEKMAENERRRMEYNSKRGITVRRPRTASSSPPVTEPKKSTLKLVSDVERYEAAKRIQRTWRARRRKQIFEAFADLGLGIEQVGESSFEKMRAVLCDQNVLAITTRMLNILQISTADEEEAVARTFLTAYLILGHPNNVMNHNGDQEHDVLQKAKDLIINFEAVLAKSLPQNRFDPPKTLVEALHIAHSAYITTFADWKAKDKTILIELLVQDFVNLDAIWQSVKDDTAGQVADDYQHAIRENQVVLLARLRKLAGPERANHLIRRAIRESRRQKVVQRRKPVGALTTPRLAPTDQISSSSAGSLSLTEPQIASASSVPANSISAGSQTRFIGQLFSVIPPNRVLTHELVIDKEHRIDNTLQSHFKDEIHRKLCNDMREAFEKGKGDEWTVAVSVNVRTKLLQLLTSSRGQGSMFQLVSDALDPELIRRQCAQGVFSYQNFFDFMANILPKLCAPVRDDDVRVLAEELQRSGEAANTLDGMLDKLFKLFHMIDVLALDYSNFLLSNVADRLIKEAPGYEQRMFAKDLDDGKITLQRTKRWWNDASVNALTEAASSHPPTMQKVYARGLVDLAIATAPLKETDMPETLELDRERINQLREQSCKVAVIGALLLGAKNMLKRDVRAQWKTEANRMWELLKSSRSRSTDNADDVEPLPVRLVSIIESSHALPPTTKSTLLATATRLLDQVALGRLTDPVAKVLFARLKTHVYGRLAATSSGERVRAVSTASENLASAGLPEFVGIVGSMVDLLGRMSEADRKSHGIWYEEIAKESAGEERSELH